MPTCGYRHRNAVPMEARSVDPLKSELRTVVSDLTGLWEWHLGPLEDQQVFLTAEFKSTPYC